jgi:radical SAM superfamily enzyme
MLGLPGETTADFSETARVLAAEDLAAVKIHNVHVIRGTALAEEFARQPFPVFDEDAFLEIVIDFIRRTPPAVAIMRVNTDTPADKLIAPRWTLSKAAFRERVVATMRLRGVRQGDLLDASGKVGQAFPP